MHVFGTTHPLVLFRDDILCRARAEAWGSAEHRRRDTRSHHSPKEAAAPHSMDGEETQEQGREETGPHEMNTTPRCCYFRFTRFGFRLH